jgi:hypothetical protein
MASKRAPDPHFWAKSSKNQAKNHKKSKYKVKKPTYKKK